VQDSSCRTVHSIAIATTFCRFPKLLEGTHFFVSGSVSPEAEALRLVYLYSSNASPQYAQDILNVLAAPPGGRYTFRYAKEYVPEELQDARWRRIKGWRALVCFSLQQEAKYQAPALIPVRLTTVRETRIVGTQHIVEFSIGDYIGLPPSADDRRVYTDQVKEFTAWLLENAPAPYEVSVGLGTSVLEEPLVDTTSIPPLLFEQAATALAGTESFREARFVRFDRITARTGHDDHQTAGDDGRIRLWAGTTYEFRLIHYQPKPVLTPEPFLIGTDGTNIAPLVDRVLTLRHDMTRCVWSCTPSLGRTTRRASQL